MTAADEGDADRALAGLIESIDVDMRRLVQARRRATELQSLRADGWSWVAIVTGDDRPLIVELVSDVLTSLGSAGSAWRREQGRALRADGMTIGQVAALFGVSRQRVVDDADRPPPRGQVGGWTARPSRLTGAVEQTARLNWRRRPRAGLGRAPADRTHAAASMCTEQAQPSKA